MKKLVLLSFLAVNFVWGICESQAHEYERCVRAYADGQGYCRGKNSATEGDVMAARAKLEACLARNMR